MIVAGRGGAELLAAATLAGLDMCGNRIILAGTFPWERSQLRPGPASCLEAERKNVHVGLVGTGRIGALHARTLKQSKVVSRLTVVDANRERAVDVANALGAEQAENALELLEAGIDALVIAAATPAHAELLHMAADASVPTFCEKPIALDLAGTDSVIEHVNRAGIFVQIGFQRRFDAGYRAARDAVRSGALGDVHVVRLATHDPAPPPEAYIGGSGGIWRDLAIHDFDIGPWVVGRPIVEVYADGQANAPLFARHDDVDAAGAMLRFEGGILGVLTATRNDPRGYDVRMEVFGLRDSVAVGVDESTPLRSLEPGVDPPGKPGYEDFLHRFAPAYRAELGTFLESLQDGGASPSPVADARQALLVALAADRSMREHRPVRVEEIG
jgi:myo-inositol 2-dehydrogenase/D-chiro-inositol 1-dehydrogenase